uniref:flagellar hook-length control protein FliK n=1 Tax=Lachnospira sp. TaxID=2049031 RepID=UPI004028093A
MVSPAVMGTGAVSNVSAKSVSGNSCSGSGSDFKKVMAASLAQNTAGAGKNPADNKLSVPIAEKSDAQTAKSSSQDVNAADAGSNNKAQSVNGADKNELNDKVNEAVQDVKDTIKDELDVSDEDIAKAMEVLGMTATDLLSVVKVTELVGELTGTDAITLITDDDMLSRLTSVLDVVNAAQQDIADMSGVNVEDVSDVIATANTEADVNKDVTDNVVSNNQPAAIEESLSDMLAKKITTDGSAKQQNNAGEQNHNTETYGSVADNMIQSMSDSFADIITEDTAYVSEADIVNQVIDQIKLTSGKELTSIEVMLNPERLGSVHVTVSAKNGILTAQIAAQNEQVKTALENQMTTLRENFENQGIKVDAVEITVMTHQFEAGQNFGQNESERKQSERKLNKKLDLSAYDDEVDDEFSDDELRRKDSIQNGNSSVEYIA